MPGPEIVRRPALARRANAEGPWYVLVAKVKPPRTRSRDRARASPDRTKRVDPLDMQVSEIRTLIDRLRQREEPKSPLADQERTALAPPPQTRKREVSSRPRRPRQKALVVPGGTCSFQRPRAEDPSVVESRLLPICERLEGVLEKLETRVAAAPAAPAGELAPLAPDCTMRGRITESLLPDLLQMVTSNRWTGVFVAGDGAFECRLYFDEGQACHAEAPGASGEGAFFAALALEQGEYHFLEIPPPADKTISSNTQFLILVALRQIDEAKGGEMSWAAETSGARIAHRTSPSSGTG